jgi:hypothetical protein
LDYLNAAAGTANNSTNGEISWFQFQGNTYVVDGLADHSTTAGFHVGTDIVVGLTGTLDLSHSHVIGTDTLLFG